MSSLRRILSSRANGARSRGPSTPAGKRRSSQNAIRHGLLAQCLVLSNEAPEGFDDLMEQHLDRLQPVDSVELGMVEEMVACLWRQRRAWAIETRTLEELLAAQHSPDEVGRIAAAFGSAANSPTLALLHRYETRLHMMYQRALHNLLLLRTACIPNEPSPISGQSDDPPDADPAEAPEAPDPAETAQDLTAESPAPPDPGPVQDPQPVGAAFPTAPPAPPIDPHPAHDPAHPAEAAFPPVRKTNTRDPLHHANSGFSPS